MSSPFSSSRLESPVSQSQAEEMVSYGEGRFRCELHRDADLYALGYKSGKEKQVNRILAIVPERGKKLHSSVMLLHIPAQLRDKIRDAIRHHIGGVVRFFTPVLVNRESKEQQILTDEIIVRFKEGVSDEQAQKTVAEEHGIIAYRLGAKPAIEYQVLVPDPTELGPLVTVRALEGKENVEYACPNSMIEVQKIE